ncbi:phage terminase small subunit P27 family [Devosia sp.]|uniref:phage terminase small subunit P27 family n=1 Tax=Devosia sp. TaxID=1871048 RepID=UPI001ACB0541|nr:phage terminase small subunit P27 family [Devosia sp.]MBN9335382.1 phage terminase small subunit P27 family [Devosia sp.]
MKGAKPTMRQDVEAVDILPAPEWFSEEAAEEWARVMPVLVPRKILTTADLGSLENYCIAQGTVREMERHIKDHGHVFEAFKERDGELISTGLKRNPAVGIRAEAMTQARQLAAELGLTPVSRSRPSIRESDDGEEDDNPLNVS